MSSLLASVFRCSSAASSPSPAATYSTGSPPAPLGDLELDHSSTPSSSSQPSTPRFSAPDDFRRNTWDDNSWDDRALFAKADLNMRASPIDITSRNNSSSPSSQGHQAGQFLEADSRTSAAIMAGLDDSFSGAKPIQMQNPNRHAEGRQRRESMANSLAGGLSWGGVSVGSWIRDE